MEPKNPLILTVRLDQKSQDFFDGMRRKYFPPERNLLNAHLTLFHQLPDDEETFNIINSLSIIPFEMEVSRLINLGAGVAYKVDAAPLETLRNELRKAFEEQLIPQDKQGFRGHITIQNKTTPDQAKSLLEELSMDFEPFKIEGHGIDLWEYLGGPWKHRSFHPFTHLDK
jgi:2'-5' RNA ligase